MFRPGVLEPRSGVFEAMSALRLDFCGVISGSRRGLTDEVAKGLLIPFGHSLDRGGGSAFIAWDMSYLLIDSDLLSLTTTIHSFLHYNGKSRGLSATLFLSYC
jgi:hypothetical protein